MNFPKLSQRFTSGLRLSMLGALLASSLGAAERPNILLVLSDDHSVPHLGAYGDPNCVRLNLTPNLDAFAAEGMRFNRAYTASPQCAPSRSPPSRARPW